VGGWEHKNYGGEPRYMVSRHGSKWSNPTVCFPYDVTRSCPFTELKLKLQQHSMRPLTDVPDQGMIVFENKDEIKIQFPTLLTFLEHHGHHVEPFETIGIRYRVNSKSKWILLAQIKNRTSSPRLNVLIDYRDKSPLHCISEISLTRNF